MTKMNPNNENEIKTSNFSWDIFKSNNFFFIGHKILKYFNDL